MGKNLHVYNRGPRMRPFLELAREAGVDVAAVLDRAGWCETALNRPDVVQEREQSVALFRAIRDLCDDPLFGLRGAARFEPRDADVLGFLVLQCEHALAAMEALSRYGRLLADAAAFEVDRTADPCVLRVGLSGGRTQLPEVVDYHAGAIHSTFSRQTGGACHPREVWLARPAPANARPWRDFFDAPVHFGAPVSTLCYDPRDVRVPFQGSSPRLREILEERAREALSQLPGAEDLAGRVQAALDAKLGGEESSALQLARELGLSERTLRRRLRAEGTSFRTLVDGSRRQRALTLLRNRELTIGEVAYRCGFSDGAAFARAFRRWTGVPPAQAQRANHDDAG